MAAGNVLATFSPNSALYTSDGVVTPSTGFRELGYLSYPQNADREYRFVGQLTQDLGASAALDLILVATEDPNANYGSAGGGTAKFTATFKKIANDEDLTSTGAGTAISEDVAVDATIGQVVVHTIDVTNAEADALAAGDPYMLILKRTGTSTGDTAGNVAVFSLAIKEST